MRKPLDNESDAVELVQSALGNHYTSLSDVLQCIARRIESFGCVLWDQVPGTDLEGSPPSGHLFVLAGWFPTDEIFAMHDLPLTYPSGMVVLNKKPIRGQHGQDGVQLFEHPFLKRHRIDRICSTPIFFSGGRLGALTLYRNVGNSAFDQNELARLETIARIVPLLAQAILHRTSLHLLQTIEGILQEAERKSKGSPLPKPEERAILHQICQNVAKSFNCLETSIFLEDRLERARVYELQATTRLDWIKKKEYTANKSEGLTGWVLATSKPIQIFDLAHFDHQAAHIQSTYPGLTWRNSLKAELLQPQVFGARTREEQPPMSFMTVPCVIGNELFGAIRCNTATKGPYYFSSRELALLQLVAAQVSQCWAAWINRREIQRKNEGWNTVVEGLGKLNDFVQSNLQGDVNLAQIFQKTLEMMRQAMPGADVNTVRLLNEETRELYYATIPVGNWPDFVRQQIEKSLQTRRFNVDDKAAVSAGVTAFREGIVVVRESVKNDINYHAIFPEVKRMIVAPIRVGSMVFGVLDARCTGNADFPANAKDIMELLGRQLGLFLQLAKTVKELSQAEINAKQNFEDLRHFQEAQLQSFEDLTHQLKTPLNQALSRARTAVHSAGSEVKQELIRIRGLCNKVNRVAKSLELLTILATKQPIKIRKSQIDHSQLMKALVEAAQDNELTVEPRRNVVFRLEKETFHHSWTSRLSADMALIEQALNCLLDNAAKYSYENTSVVIKGGPTRSNHRCFVTVANRGIPISKEDIPRLTERGYRSKAAADLDFEGSGIGLWIVDHIMKAHGGSLHIAATKPDGITEITLVFPLIPYA